MGMVSRELDHHGSLSLWSWPCSELWGAGKNTGGTQFPHPQCYRDDAAGMAVDEAQGLGFLGDRRRGKWLPPKPTVGCPKNGEIGEDIGWEAWGGWGGCSREKKGTSKETRRGSEVRSDESTPSGGCDLWAEEKHLSGCFRASGLPIILCCCLMTYSHMSASSSFLLLTQKGKQPFLVSQRMRGCV